jgi:phage/plasmid-like protein (TIGR03299 family)
MGHGITATDEVFSVRREMWHGLGQVLPEYPTRAEAQQLVHPWEPVSEPLYRQVPVVDPETGDLTVQYIEAKSAVLNVRSDNSAELGAVSPTFENIKNAEMYDIAEAIEGDEPGAVRLETGGSLDGGKKVWLLLKLREPLLVPGDPNGTVVPYYVLQNNHDAAGAFRGQSTIVRVVCANTSAAADYDAKARGTEFSFRHTKNVADRIAQAKQALAGWRESLLVFQELSQELVAQRVSDYAVKLFIEEFVPMPIGTTISERVQQHVQEARAEVRGILDGPTSEGIRNTQWGLVQAAVEWQNHYRRANTAESRFKRAYLDRSRVTTDAISLARSLATV